MADKNVSQQPEQEPSMNGRGEASGSTSEDNQVMWVPVLHPDMLELDKHTMSTLQSLPPGTILLDPGKSGGFASVEMGDNADSAQLQGIYLRPIMMNDNHDSAPAILTRPQDRGGLDNEDGTSPNPEPLAMVHFKDSNNIELNDSDNKNANHVSTATRGDLEGAFRLDGNLFIRDDNLNESHGVDVSWAQDPSAVILAVDKGPKSDGDIMVNMGVRAHNDPWLSTFDDSGLQKSPSGRGLEAAPEELSPLVDGAGEKIEDYLEAEDHHEGGGNTPPQVQVASEEFKIKPEEPLEPAPDGSTVPQRPRSDSVESSSSSSTRPTGTYLSHLPVKKRKMDNNFSVSSSQLVTEAAPHVTMVTVASPLVLPASSMTASSLLLSALTAVPKSSKSTGVSLTGLCVNSTTGLLEPATSSGNVLSLGTMGTGETPEAGSSVGVVEFAPLDPPLAGTSSTADDQGAGDSEALPCADNANFIATFCCTYCQAELESWEKAQSHRFTHQIDSTPATFYVRYHCTPCGGSFDTWEEAQEHSTDNASVPLVTCNVCSSLIPANNMYDHITSHTKQTPEKLSTKLAVQVLKLQKDEENYHMAPSKSEATNSSSLEHLPLSKKLELQTALLQADIKRFRVLRKTIKKVQRQSSSTKSPEHP